MYFHVHGGKGGEREFARRSEKCGKNGANISSSTLVSCETVKLYKVSKGEHSLAVIVNRSLIARC